MTVTPAFDPVIHAPLRLQICALLAPVTSMEFATLRGHLDVSESVLSKHLKTLEDAGHIRIRKATSNSRVRTSAAMTPEGRAAYDAHVAELRRIVGAGPDRGPNG
ncbi:transcriptional regulator [Rhodococcoides corynebacterioides]|uniref:Transcriptional regulator n=1 Tax=Rhodococcoides corynebacterioides TaxID=53972 RepID=A0ABS7P693_9NOCA|nr:transcriptional regulator [Rhodococcus corynebacterioides]MBY6367933.1 transcriptional regulator [Rhodococcus corynebacterioides]MBY6409439.1 transcriptional regulator [Rhodococcus corynebacterioides]